LNHVLSRRWQSDSIVRLKRIRGYVTPWADNLTEEKLRVKQVSRTALLASLFIGLTV
jgi:hypothetical protein